MQLTNSAVIVDFFPEALIAEACEKKGMKTVVKRFQKRVTFRDSKQKSYSTIGMIDFKHEVASRIAKGAEVTDFNLDQMPREEYRPLYCWCCIFFPLLFHFFHDQFQAKNDPGDVKVHRYRYTHPNRKVWSFL